MGVLRTKSWTLLVLGVFSFFLLGGCVDKTNKSHRIHYQIRSWSEGANKGYVLESEHYILYTTVADPSYREVLINLAELQYLRFSHDLTVQPIGKQRIYVFGNVREWIGYTKLRFPSVARNLLKIRSGGYTYMREAVFYYLGRYATSTILAHELFHLYLLYSASGRVPAWLNEGLACWYEALEWAGNEPVFTPRKNLFRIQHLREAYATNKLFPLKTILNTSAFRMTSRTYSDMLIYYAEVWALIRYLRDPVNKRYYERFKTLLRELGTKRFSRRVNGYMRKNKTAGVNFDQSVFEEYITNDIEGFEKGFFGYIRDVVGMRF